MGMLGRVRRAERRRGGKDYILVIGNYGECKWEGQTYTYEQMGEIAHERGKRLVIIHIDNIHEKLGFSTKEEYLEWERKMGR